jgi:hypothetical protein
MQEPPVKAMRAAAAAAVYETDGRIAAVLPPPNRHPIRSAFVYLALLAGIFPLWPGAELIAAPLVLIAVLGSWRDLRFVPRILLVLIAICVVASLLWAPRMLLAAGTSTDRLTPLVIAVMLLSATLGKSRGIGELAASLLAGKALPRYLGLTATTGFLAIPLNFGSTAVMSAMLGRVIEHSGDSASARNMARAILRGFSLASMASPLSVSMAITVSLMPGLSVQGLIAITLPFALCLVLLGAFFREAEEPMAAESGVGAIAANPQTVLRAWLRFAAYIAAICIGAFALYDLTGMPYSRAVAISCSSAAVFGLLAARRRGESAAPPGMGHIGNEVTVMCGSAFLGVMASGVGHWMLGPDFALPLASLPLVAFVVPWSLFVGGIAGLNPIVTGTFVGAMLAPIWPSAALLGLGFGLLSGWGLTIAGTPYTASAMLLSRLTGYDAKKAALKWNITLSLCGLGSAGLLAALLTYLHGFR